MKNNEIFKIDYNASIQFTTSARRWHLDRFLTQINFSGDVLDVGGKKDNKRGAFRPPFDKGWKYLNLSAETNPDFLCDAESIPVEDKSFDYVSFCEVLEHLERPCLVLKEIHRVLRDGGELVGSMPLHYPIHGDPHDFQRWTNTKIEAELKGVGFSKVQIIPMGGLWSVFHDLIRMNGKNGFLTKVFLRVLRVFVFTFSSELNANESSVTTGWFFLAKK